MRWFLLSFACSLMLGLPLRAEIIVAEGESFTPLDDKGWKLTHQDDSYGSHTYGGMWMTHGGCLGAPADSVGSVAKKAIVVGEKGTFRVWSKYQAPPYFNYLHQVEIEQKGKVVFRSVYGKKGTPRLWSFSGVSDELWWPWGVDHDCAEAPQQTAALEAGPAEIRLTTLANPKPAGARFVDFLVLTTNLADDYEGHKPYRVGSPFAFEALRATQLFVRFKNTSGTENRLSVSRAGHFQPNYGGETIKIPAGPDPKAKMQPSVAAGQWSDWINIGPFLRLVHDEGVTVTLPGATEVPLQFAFDAQGKNTIADVKVPSDEPVVIPIDITWNKKAVIKPSRQHAQEIIAESKTWRKANGGKKPKEILYYGAFRGSEPWVSELKATLGYNTALPSQYEQVKRSGLHAHSQSPKAIEDYAAKLTDKDNFLVLSFGDEISLGSVNFKDPKLNEKFRTWLKAKNVTAKELGVDPNDAVLSPKGEGGLLWYTQVFNEEERFGFYRGMTKLAKDLIGAHVLTGANFSPHHGCLYYGSIYQWVDLFRHNGMSMFWAEDYIFSVPEPPQLISWMFGQMRCAVKYNKQPIHFYVMPHAPGQESGFLRRNMLVSVGFGARHIDSFWVGPAERFTENFVAWNYRPTFRTIAEAIYDSAEVEKLQASGTVRPGRVAVVMSKATDFHETRLLVDKERDPFAAVCKNAPKQVNQTLCRKEQQMLYLALRHAQHGVELITEEDIVDGALKNFDAVYFAGEWIDSRIEANLKAWVEAGGVLYACAGLGQTDHLSRPYRGLLDLLGLESAETTKNAYHLRTLLELPLTTSIDTIQMTSGEKIDAIAMKTKLAPKGASVLGKWSDGSPAVTVNKVGKGRAFAIGALPATSYMKTAVRETPWARGGKFMLYNPTEFNAAAAKLVRLGVDARPITQAAVCSNSLVEAIVLDAKTGTLVTLANWTNAPVKDLKVQIRLDAAPTKVRSVEGQKDLAFKFDNGVLEVTLDLAEADYLTITR